MKGSTSAVAACGLRGTGWARVLGIIWRGLIGDDGWRSEASQAFIDVAFTRLGLECVEADAEEGNVASEHILQKCGFKYVRREVIPGRGRIINFYKLAKVEWQRGRGA